MGGCRYRDKDSTVHVPMRQGPVPVPAQVQVQVPAQVPVQVPAQVPAPVQVPAQVLVPAQVPAQQVPAPEVHCRRREEQANPGLCPNQGWYRSQGYWDW